MEGIAYPSVQSIAAVLLFGVFIYLAAPMFGFGGKNQFQVDGQTVLITGGSEGMGRSVAIELSKKGANVVIVSRTVSKLEAALNDIKAAALYPERQKFHYVSADLKDHEGTEYALEEVSKWNGGQPPDIVWCCAGMSLPGFFVTTPPETLKSQMDTIYWTAAFTAHSTLSRWLSPVDPSSRNTKSSPRHIIFTSSAAVFVPLAGYGPYSPAKAAMRALADTLAQEIEVYNGSRKNLQQPAPAADVKIHIVYPMGILSPGFAHEQTIKPDLTKLLEEADKPQTPEEVAKISIKGLEKGEYMITTMLIGALMKGAAMGSSPRNNIIIDTLISMVSAIAFIFVIPDLAGKAWNWGRTHGVPKPR